MIPLSAPNSVNTHQYCLSACSLAALKQTIQWGPMPPRTDVAQAGPPLLTTGAGIFSEPASGEIQKNCTTRHADVLQKHTSSFVPFAQESSAVIRGLRSREDLIGRFRYGTQEAWYAQSNILLLLHENFHRREIFGRASKVQTFPLSVALAQCR